MPLNLSKELAHVREQVSPNSLTNSCSGEGCRVYLTDLPKQKIVINVEKKFDARKDNRKRSDRLLFYGKQNTFVAVSMNKHIPIPKTKPYTKTLKEAMRRKSEILSKAQAFWEIGIEETAQPLWLSAATYDEHIAPMLDALGRELEGALHRISAALCYEKKKIYKLSSFIGLRGLFFRSLLT